MGQIAEAKWSETQPNYQYQKGLLPLDHCVHIIRLDCASTATIGIKLAVPSSPQDYDEDIYGKNGSHKQNQLIVGRTIGYEQAKMDGALAKSVIGDQSRLIARGVCILVKGLTNNVRKAV